MAIDSSVTPITNDGDKSVVMILNGLIHICREGHDGYMQAANGITSSAYKTMFVEYAHQRNRFASQLANLVLEYGGDPDDDGHSMTMFPRGWTNIQPAVMGGDYGAIFAECEKSEDSAKNAYEQVMEKEIPEDVSTIINRQYRQISEAYDRVHNLREAYYLEHKN